MLKISLPITILVLACTSFQAGLSQSSSSAQNEAAENTFFQTLADSKNQEIDLHTLSPNAQGIRELGIGEHVEHYYIVEPGVTTLSPNGTVDYRSPFATRQAADLHGFYCSAGAIVIARSLGSSSHITTDGRLIYTKTQFVATQILKPGLGITEGGHFSALALGGQVTDSGETLSIHVAGGAPLTQGGFYLLSLKRSPKLPDDDYLIDSKETVEVVDSHIHPLGSPIKGVFEAGEPLSKLVSQWAELTKASQCPSR